MNRIFQKQIGIGPTMEKMEENSLLKAYNEGFSSLRNHLPNPYDSDYQREEFLSWQEERLDAEDTFK